jgi:hypothetical protein
MSMWTHFPGEADALPPSVVPLAGLQVDERGRVRVRVDIQQVTLFHARC